MVGLDNPLHIALVLIVVLMVFGAKRLPEMGKGLGEGMRGFKQAISGETPAPASQISLASLPSLRRPRPSSRRPSRRASRSRLANCRTTAVGVHRQIASFGTSER
jgi:sec-independent protein translocase protein TatA